MVLGHEASQANIVLSSYEARPAEESVLDELIRLLREPERYVATFRNGEIYIQEIKTEVPVRAVRALQLEDYNRACRIASWKVICSSVPLAAVAAVVVLAGAGYAALALTNCLAASVFAARATALRGLYTATAFEAPQAPYASGRPH